jgi:nitric oxide reductase subunit B
MSLVFRIYIRFALLLLIATLVFGLLSSWAFLYPETYNSHLPFFQLRPLHVSSALFWIISGATACLWFFKTEVFALPHSDSRASKLFMVVWMLTVIAIFMFYAFKKFGGREYWEFPPWLSFPILLSWISLMVAYFNVWRKAQIKMAMHVVMWSTGILFFFITFIEQNLWQIPWFRESFLRELTVQWKANGATVGAWNQMIYGSSLFIMVKISGDQSIADNNKVRLFYFLSLTNLMFNWGHHIYNLPANNWVRHVSYAISMTEWLFFISIIQGFKSKLEERRKHRHLLTYKFLIAAEGWLFANLLLALMMSIPAINRYTHGTHITVAHAMGTTIGINTMILLGAIGYMLRIEDWTTNQKRLINICYYTTQVSLMLFWLSLIVAGILKGYRQTVMSMTNFQEMMQPVIAVLKVFSVAGIGVMLAMGITAVVYLKNVDKLKQENLPKLGSLIKFYGRGNQKADQKKQGADAVVERAS